MPTSCRDCRMEINPSETLCPSCLRLAEFSQIKEEQRRRNRLLPLLIAAALPAAFFVFRERPLAAPGIKRYIGAQIQRFQNALEKVELGGNDAAKTPSPLDSPQAPKLPQADAAIAPTRWTVSGRVYDLMTLKLLPNTRLSFASPDGRTTKVWTDQDGRYSATMPILKEGGYTLIAKHKGYSGKYIEEIYVSFPQMSREQRLDEARDAATSKILHVPITVDETGILTYNIALLPRSD